MNSSTVSPSSGPTSSNPRAAYWRFGWPVTLRRRPCGARGLFTKDVGAPQLDNFRDAAQLPVLYALHTTGPGVKAKRSGEFSRAAEAVDNPCVGVMLFHGAY